MEQLNKALPDAGEEKKSAETALIKSVEPSLLNKVRQNFQITGVISLLFGILFTASFYEARIGSNAFLFTAVMICMLIYFMHKFELPVKKVTKLYYAASFLLGLSTALTENETMQFLNTIATIILLNLSLLHQLHKDSKWDFMKHLAKMFGMLFLGIAAFAIPFIDSVSYFKRNKISRNEKVWNIILGIIISLPILICVTALLSSADLLFGAMTRNIFHLFITPDIISIIIMTLFGFLSCYLILCGAAAQTCREDRKRSAKADASIASTVMAVICLVYLVFCGLQVIYLFAGGWFSLPEGYTYAEYARKGFFELLAVAIINIILMLVFTVYFEDNKLLRLLLVVMTACTYVMIFSAAYRMFLYIDTYHLTFLRLFVLLCLLILAILLVGVIISVYRRGFPLFQYFTAVIAISYLVFSLARPDYRIADYYESKEEKISYEDAYYLVHTLSLDAAPVVLPLLTEQDRFQADITKLREEYYRSIDSENSERKIRDFNLSSKQAKYYSEKYPIQ